MADKPEVSLAQLGDVIGEKISAALTPVVESVKAVGTQVADLEAKGAAALVPEPDPTPAPQDGHVEKSWEQRCEAYARKHHENLKEYGNRWSLPPEDEFSLVRFLVAQIERNWKHAPYEKWCWEQTQKLHAQRKALSYGTTTAGGYIVDSQYLPREFVNNLYAAMVLRRAGARSITCNGSPVNIPAKTASGTAYWNAEAGTLTASSQTFAQIQMTPKWCIGRTQLSEFLVNFSEPAAETIVREDLAEVIGVEVDKQFIIGTGTTNKPLGIVSTDAPGTAGAAVIGTNGGAFTLTKAHEMVYALEVDNVPTDGCVWLMHPRTWNTIRQLQTQYYTNQTAGGEYYLRPDVSQQEVRRLLGYPVYTTTNLPINLTKGSGSALGYVIFVKATDILIGEWGAIDLRVTDVGGIAWTNNSIEVKATVTTDVDMRRAESICVLSDTTS